MVYTDSIANASKTAFFLRDRISVEEKVAREVKNSTKKIFEDAQIAFYGERYEEAEELLNEFREAVEQEELESSTLKSLQRGIKTFVQNYWLHIIIILIFVFLAGAFFYKRIQIKLLERKISGMKTEKEVLTGLMKKAQTERFKENKISGMIYNIRMKKYTEKLERTKQELPVLESRFAKLKT